MYKKLVCIFFIIFSALSFFSTSPAADSWNEAQKAFQAFKKDFNSVNKVSHDEAEKIVKAICEAKEDQRKTAAVDSSKRAKDRINQEKKDFERLKEKAVEKLDEVIKNDATHKSQAENFKKTVLSNWSSFMKSTQGLRGANHPVAKYMLKVGNKEHLRYQKSSSRCTVYEFPISDAGRADCILASKCMVIELKPDNSRAINKGKEQAKKYAEKLNAEIAKTVEDVADSKRWEITGKLMPALIKKSSKFKECFKKTFKHEVQCYRYCPDIREGDLEYRTESTRWRKCG